MKYQSGNIMKEWEKEILDKVKKNWGFLESKDIKIQQLIEQVCIFTMVEVQGVLLLDEIEEKQKKSKEFMKRFEIGHKDLKRRLEKLKKEI